MEQLRYWRRRDLIHHELLECEEQFFSEVLERRKPNSMVLLGCGVGKGFSIIKGEQYGVDFNIGYLKEGKGHHPAAQLFLASLEALPFQRAVFDLGILIQVLQHVPSGGNIRQVAENIKATCVAVALEEGVSLPETCVPDTPQYNHDYETLFKPLKATLFQPRGDNAYTHFFLFEPKLFSGGEATSNL